MQGIIVAGNSATSEGIHARLLGLDLARGVAGHWKKAYDIYP
jgi:hypothetical protein